jgi:fluoride ion exporter CrcB/FEX
MQFNHNLKYSLIIWILTNAFATLLIGLFFLILAFDHPRTVSWDLILLVGLIGSVFSLPSIAGLIPLLQFVQKNHQHKYLHGVVCILGICLLVIAIFLYAFKVGRHDMADVLLFLSPYVVCAVGSFLFVLHRISSKHLNALGYEG